MLQTLTTVLELVGFALVAAGAWLRWGEAIGLMFSGAVCVLVGYLVARTPPTPPVAS